MFEQRNHKRFKTVWKVYFREADGKYHLTGFLLDIGDGGARFFLDSILNFAPKKNEIIKVLIKPDIKEIEPKGISVKISWFKLWKTQDSTYELGVEFCRETPEETAYVDSLVKNFALQNPEKDEETLTLKE